MVLRVNSDIGGQYEVLDVNGGTCCLHLKDSLRSKLEQVPTSPPGKRFKAVWRLTVAWVPLDHEDCDFQDGDILDGSFERWMSPQELAKVKRRTFT